MGTPARLICVLGWFAAMTAGSGGEPPAPEAAPPSPAAVSFDAPEPWFRWPTLPSWQWIVTPATSAPIPDIEMNCEFPHWYMPVEIYAQAGPIFEVGRGPLSNLLNTGLNIEVGAKNYCYDPDRTGAWLGILGLDFQLNAAPSDARIILHHGVKDNLDWIFRIYGRIGVGREWYYRGDDIPEGWRYVFGVDVAGLLGHTHAHLASAPVEQTTINGTEVRILDLSDVAIGATVGAHVGVVIPRHRSDLILAGHLDYEHEWSRIADNDKHLDEFIFLLSASVRW